MSLEDKRETASCLADVKVYSRKDCVKMPWYFYEFIIFIISAQWLKQEKQNKYALVQLKSKPR